MPSPTQAAIAGALLACACLGILCGGLSGFAPDLAPFSPLTRFFELVAPALLLAALIAALGAAWLGRQSAGLRYAGLALAGLGLISFGPLGAAHFNNTRGLSAGAADLRVLFYNVYGGNETAPDKIIEHILHENPDVVILAEPKKLKDHLSQIESHLKFYQKYEINGSRTKIYSKYDSVKFYDISLKLFRPFGKRLSFISNYGEERFHIIGVHFMKPWNTTVTPYERRRLAEEIEELNAPFLVIGDFNMPSWSRGMSELTQKIQAYGQRMPIATWPAAAAPFGIQIDHALVGGGMQITSVKPFGNGLGSNHRGLVVELRLPR